MLIRKLQQYKPEKKFLLLKHLEQLGGVGEGSQAPGPSDVHLGMDSEKEHWDIEHGGMTVGQKLFCGSQENEILLPALSLLCGFEKVPETELLRYTFPGHSSPAPFSPASHSPLFQHCTTGSPAFIPTISFLPLLQHWERL